jgi:hypothetical protein
MVLAAKIIRMSIHLWQFMLVTLAGWINRQQQIVIEYLMEENRVLRELHGKKRLRFTDAQRTRLAAKAKSLGRNHVITKGAPRQRPINLAVAEGHVVIVEFLQKRDQADIKQRCIRKET